jgi:hypothetical protein
MSSFCLGCGTSLSEGERFCGNCGRDSSLPLAAAPPDPAASFGFPPETSGKAIFSLVCGVLFLFPPSAIVAVIFGHLSLSEIRRSARRLAGRGLAIAGLVLGYMGVAITAVWVVLIAVSIPKTLQQARGGSETSAVATMRTLNTAEIAYAQAHPATGYTCSLSDLSGTWGIRGDLAQGRKNGYVFALQGCSTGKPGGPIAKYQLVAYPQTGGNSAPAFCSNESDVIKVSRNGSAKDCLRSGVDLSAGEVNHPQAWPPTSR